jgi:hypothetical protein
MAQLLICWRIPGHVGRWSDAKFESDKTCALVIAVEADRPHARARGTALPDEPEPTARHTLFSLRQTIATPPAAALPSHHP